MTRNGRRAAVVFVVMLAVAGLAGLAVQAFAQPANHPQLEAVRTAVSRLDRGASPAEVVPSSTIDLASSNDLFVIVTDANHNVLASSASLGGAKVVPPAGVFDYVRANGEDRVTWQPAEGVRSWIVVDSFSGGFVVAGRSPSGAEQSAYLLLLWGSVGALALAAVGGVGVVGSRFL